MDGDGTKAGYDVEVTRLVSRRGGRAGRRVGGVREPAAHDRGVLQQTRADAVLAASIFHFGEYSIAQTKRAMADAGLPVRAVSGGVV